MDEYDNKIKELNDLRKWCDEHVNEMIRRHDVFVIIAPEYNDDDGMRVYFQGRKYQVRHYLTKALYDIEMKDQ